MGRGEGGVIADGVARAQLTDLDDRGLRTGHLPDLPGQFGPWHAAIERQAGAGEIAMIGPAQHDPGAIGEAGAAVGQLRAGLLPEGELPGIVRAILVGAGEVGEQHIDIEPRHRLIAQRIRG